MSNVGQEAVYEMDGASKLQVVKQQSIPSLRSIEDVCRNTAAQNMNIRDKIYSRNKIICASIMNYEIHRGRYDSDAPEKHHELVWLSSTYRWHI